MECGVMVFQAFETRRITCGRSSAHADGSKPTKLHEEYLRKSSLSQRGSWRGNGLSLMVAFHSGRTHNLFAAHTLGGGHNYIYDWAAMAAAARPGSSIGRSQ
jgi:hypothetical protein